MFFVFATLAGFARMAPITIPGAAAALALFAPGRRHILVANLMGDSLEACMRVAAHCVRRRPLEPANVAIVVHAPTIGLCVALAARALAWLDLEG